MTEKRQRKYDLGRTATWIVILIITGIVLGIYLANRGQASGQAEPRPSRVESIAWKEILHAPVCAVPVIAITSIVLGFTIVQGYYSVQRLEAQRRIQAAEAAEREEDVRQHTVQTKRRLQELNDLTVNLTTGEEVARLMEGPDGELLLVRPGLATKPVSRIDPDAVREESEQVRVAAMLANAARYGSRGYSGGQQSSSLSLEMAALAMLQGGSASEQRLPGKVRILQEDEIRMLEDKQ
jgi:hypothetical protein